jgi:thiol-disulfide isomerase/thioredoxin
VVFDGAIGWLNSSPLGAADLRAKVVLVDFWTYTCINWLRTLAYVRAWAEKYQDHGLVVIGVHTPEFPFEHDVDNVRQAVTDMAVDYPVALDNDYAVWRAFDNRYWPAVYIADGDGRIRHHQFGEGGYEECERLIQRLLSEAGREGVSSDLVSVAPDGLEAQADWASLQSPETYLGFEQARRFASPGDAALDRTHTSRPHPRDNLSRSGRRGLRLHIRLACFGISRSLTEALQKQASYPRSAPSPCTFMPHISTGVNQ